jgi:hypothetical protein
MICPFIKNLCVGDKCAIWIDNQCAIFIIAKRSFVSPIHEQLTTTNPMEILESCAKKIGRKNITLLKRREIDDFLALSQIVLDSAHRRLLFRKWREMRRLAKEKYHDNSREWSIEYSNSGQPWSNDEDAELKQSFSEGISIDQIAQNHRRSEGAILSRLKKHGLISE